MSSKNKKAIRILGICVLVLIVVVLAVAFFISRVQSGDGVKVQLYFLNPAANRLEPEEHFVRQDTNKDMVIEVLQLLHDGPRNKNLVKTMDETVWPPINLKIAEKQTDNYCIFEVEFSEEYHQMDPTAELFFRASLVWTMTGLPFIDNVHIYVAGEELLNSVGKPMGWLNRSNVMINPQIPSAKSEMQTVSLYFTDQQSMGLVREERVINVNPDQPLQKYILEQLIAGPQAEGNIALIPPETKLREVKKEETDTICYVNFSSEFVSKHPGGVMEKLTVYAVVNALTELSDVKKVQILVEGEKLTSYKGSFDLSNPLERDEGLILE